jgi:hypothetical protein
MGEKMKKDNQTIRCDVKNCSYYKEKHCSLDKIKVAPCNSIGDQETEKGTKEATMCDSFEEQ